MTDILITGYSGFVGQNLAEFLSQNKGIRVHGLVRPSSKVTAFKHHRIYKAQITDRKKIESVLKRVKPDYIFHLAAHSVVGKSWKDARIIYQTNIEGQLNLLEAVRSLKLQSVFHVAGSSEEYGKVLKEELPIKEDNSLRPLNPYAVSKVTQNLMGYQYFQNFGIPVIRTRAFVHIGPGQRETYVASNFARQIALMEKGLQKPVLWVGNLSAVRDFTDVRDVVKAYWLAVREAKPGEVYNICSGRGVVIQEIVDRYLKLAKIKITVKQDPARMRPSDAPCLVGDNSKFRKLTGWKSEIPLSRTLSDILDYWRTKIGAH